MSEIRGFMREIELLLSEQVKLLPIFGFELQNSLSWKDHIPARFPEFAVLHRRIIWNYGVCLRGEI